MYNHQPSDYECPFCGLDQEANQIRQGGIIYQDDRIISFISRDWWPQNPGHVLIIPKLHFENIYTLPFPVSDRIHRFAKCVALALKEVYHCDGVSTRQHNEPAGNQDVWHYHLHVFPRYVGDNLYHEKKAESNIEDRIQYVQKLKTYFDANIPVLD